MNLRNDDKVITMAAMGFDEWLVRAMQEHGVSRTELIRRLSRPGESDQRQNVYKWLSGERVPRYDKCQKIADALEIPHEEVLAAAGYLGEDPRVIPGQIPIGENDQVLSATEVETLRAILHAFGEITPGDLVRLKRLMRALGPDGDED